MRGDITGHHRTSSDIIRHHRVRNGRRVPYRPSPGPATRMVVACRIARCRIVCRIARRRVASRPVPARPSDLGVPAVFMVGRAERPSSAMPRPNSACSRRRQPRFANVYSFASPWRFMNARSAARLRRGVGRHLNPKRPCRTERGGHTTKMCSSDLVKLLSVIARICLRNDKLLR